jgi:uncharacterized protein YggE
MKKLCLFILIMVSAGFGVRGQESGNRNYNPQTQRNRPDTSTVLLNGEQVIVAYVMLNAPPDEFIAVFGASQVAPTAAESNNKVNAQIEQFLNAAERLGVLRANTFVDFITQNRVYSFNPPSEGAIRETVSGFETKKTVAVRYKARPMLDKLLAAAVEASIFDLIKVDYVINDLSKIRSRLFEEATRIIKQKEENYIRTLGLAIRRYSLLQETYNTFYPGQLYQTYTAFESGAVDSNSESNTRVIRARKSSTSYLEPLDRSAFDAVLDSMSIEPMVQCTLYMRVSYSLAK